MDDEQIKAHAEARANMMKDSPTEVDFRIAETEIRIMVGNGWTYSETDGWTPPSDTPALRDTAGDPPDVVIYDDKGVIATFGNVDDAMEAFSQAPNHPDVTEWTGDLVVASVLAVKR